MAMIPIRERLGKTRWSAAPVATTGRGRATQVLLAGRASRPLCAAAGPARRTASRPAVVRERKTVVCRRGWRAQGMACALVAWEIKISGRNQEDGGTLVDL